MQITTRQDIVQAAMSLPGPAKDVQAIHGRLRAAGLNEEQSNEAIILMTSVAWLHQFGHRRTTTRIVAQRTADPRVLKIAEEAEPILSVPQAQSLQRAETLLYQHEIQAATSVDSDTAAATQRALTAVRQRAVAHLEAGLRATALAQDRHETAGKLAENVLQREQHTQRAVFVVEWVLNIPRIWAEEPWSTQAIAQHIQQADEMRAHSLQRIKDSQRADLPTGCAYILAEGTKQAGRLHQADDPQTRHGAQATVIWHTAMHNAPRN